MHIKKVKLEAEGFSERVIFGGDLKMRKKIVIMLWMKSANQRQQLVQRAFHTDNGMERKLKQCGQLIEWQKVRSKR